MALFCLLFILPMDIPSSHIITLSSDDHGVLYYPTWPLKNRFYNDGMILVIKGSARDQEGLCLYRWDDKGFEKLFTTTPREGIFNARSAVVSPTGNKIFLGDYIPGLFYEYTPGGEFKRIGQAEDNELLVLYSNTLLRGSRHPDPRLELVTGSQLPTLETLNAHLPKDTQRTEARIANENHMLAALNGDLLAIGYKLFNQIAVFNLTTGKRVRLVEFSHPFPGYTPAPTTYENQVVNNDLKGYVKRAMEWEATFNRLMQIAWHKDRLYGFFFRDSEGRGIWACLELEKENPYFWNNDTHEDQLLNVGPHRVVMGRVQEKPGEALIWTLWQSNSLPAP